MIWSDKEILKKIQEQSELTATLFKAINTHREEFTVVLNRIAQLESADKELLSQIYKATETIKLLQTVDFNTEKWLHDLSNTVVSINKTTNSKMLDVEVRLRDELEFALRGLMTTLDKRLKDMGENKGIVTDLLKKIAKLEPHNVSA